MWIKVCGVRDLETARQLAELKVDAIGLNFYASSPRVVSIDIAEAISKSISRDVSRVGVFVNHPIREVEIIASRCQLDLIQLHGDEPPAYLADLQRRLPHLRFIRAWRMNKDRLKSLKLYLDECRNWNGRLAACLIDAHVGGMYGGSGKTVPWGRLATDYQTTVWPPLILAGGLKPDNIAEAISVSRPWGVDVASGVESAPGVKNLDLVHAFIEKARSAERALKPQPIEANSAPADEARQSG
ncbi:phosphoribosylanthranilate isomerase [Schlesneria paludicola]|uniref:phosphoribosylanthranilate isomerase n=1 Tax=Schlesneria paludicola TaxID=360056 RepID=UPI00029A718C|nr:phosphoribosylanthranilate isomerase [Schlesneria paludicola]